MKDYRIEAARARDMKSKEIVEAVLYRIAKDAPSYGNDAAMGELLRQLNPKVAAVFSTWMATGFIANGGLFHVYEHCCADMVARAGYGFRLLEKPEIAFDLERSFRAFPNCVVPRDKDEVDAALEDWGNREETNTETTEQRSLRGVGLDIRIGNAYDSTEQLLEKFWLEFVREELEG